MAERDDELMQLKARVAELEARPSSSDLEWLKNSNVFKRAELATSPTFIRLNAIIVLGGIFVIFICPLLYLFITKRMMGM